MTLVPTFGNVILKVDKSDGETTDSGLIVKSERAQAPAIGIIEACNLSSWNHDGTADDETVKVGDKVIFKPYSPDVIKVDGDDIYIVEEDDILAVINA